MKPKKKKASRTMGRPARKTQYDPGRFRLFRQGETSTFGALGVVATTESFGIHANAVAATATRGRKASKRLATLETPVIPVGETRPLDLESIWDGSYQYGDLPRLVGQPFHQFDVTIQKNAPYNRVGPGQAAGPAYRMFDQGWYKIKQGGYVVGKLAIEYDGEKCLQYWLLNTKATPNEKPYVWPGPNAPYVVNKISWWKSFTANASFQDLLSAPPKPVLTFGEEVYLGLQQPRSARRSTRPRRR